VREKTVIQLFNGGAAPETQPDRLGEIANQAFQDAGLKVRTLPPHRWPWNPFARMHNAFRGLDPLRTLRVLLSCRKADLICAHLESGVLLLLARRIFRFKVPLLIWEVPWSPGWRYREIVTRLAVPRAQGCVVFSSNQIGLIHEKYGPDVPVFLQPFHTDTEFYSPRPGADSQCKIVWSCGLDSGRDFAVLLEASRDMDAIFRIKAPKNVNAPAADYPNVIFEDRFLPPEEFRQQYADASVVVVCTKETHNASGVTSLMESLSMGRPTIVSNNPALWDYLPPGDTVLIVPIGDAAALRKAITYILENPDTAEAMGRKARAFAEQRFGAKRHYHDMAKLYLNVLDCG
jgi:glycosyltransferase involved in cell wall biosynthesis